ncbi:MAG: ATP-binding protein [Syntrophotaleaceae bacterium]
MRTASHDLRSPLTIIIGFAEFLKKNYQDSLGCQGTTLLGRIEQGGHKMRQLLEDLLAFAQVGYLDTPDETIDVNQVVKEVILAQSITAKGLTINSGHLPGIQVPRSFLHQLFENLIGNAVRYAGASQHPIEIGGQRQHQWIRYFVRDHGPGVALPERERIFEPFFRGAAAKKVPGSGIGLATVQKIAHLYGGRAWLEETPGGGCTFWVQMQDKQPEQTHSVSDNIVP